VVELKTDLDEFMRDPMNAKQIVIGIPSILFRHAHGWETSSEEKILSTTSPGPFLNYWH
jgi:hypothetical protein